MASNTFTPRPVYGAAVPAMPGVPAPLSSGVASDPLQRIGLTILLIFLVLFHCRVLDYRGYQLHIPGFLLAFGLMIAALTGGLKFAVNTKLGKLLLAYTIWIAVCTPFSTWRGGSFMVLRTLVQVFLTALMVNGLIALWEDYRKVIRAVTVGLFGLSMVAYVFFRGDSGRLASQSGRAGNANDLANMLLMSLPLLWAMTRTEKGIWKVFAYLAPLPICYQILRTGSRGGMAAAAVIGLIFFLRATMAARIRMLVLGIALAAAGLLLLPRVTLMRYLTFLQPAGAQTEEELMMQVSAASSSGERLHMLLQSLEYTVKNPLFGVGPGQFPVVAAKEAALEGVGASWVHTHNSYTQASSEAGFPAGILFISCFVVSLGALQRLYRRTRGIPALQDINAMANGVQLSMIGLLVFSFFANFAYSSDMPILATLSVALARVAGLEIARRTAASGAAPQAPRPPLYPPPRWKFSLPGANA